MRAEAHLHITKFRKGDEACISLRKLPNLQVEYAGTVVLSDVTFSVQPSGLKRYRETGQKNVHAFVRGTLVEANAIRESPKATKIKWREARYNPNETDTFVDKDTHEPLTQARAAWLVGSKVFYVT